MGCKYEIFFKFKVPFFFFSLVTSSNRRLFVTQISDFFRVNIGMERMCEHLCRKYFFAPKQTEVPLVYQLN